MGRATKTLRNKIRLISPSKQDIFNIKNLQIGFDLTLNKSEVTDARLRGFG